jgi:chorismate-pyruvate lyase
MLGNDSERATNALRLLRIDLQESLRQSTLHPRSLSSFQRILLTTDGTVTEILEAHLWEAIQIHKLFQEVVETEFDIAYLHVASGTKVLIRKVLLRGKMTHKNYIYAESITAVDHLDANLRHGLLKTQKPLGQLMIENRMETFREILVCRPVPAEDLAQYFAIKSEETLISRTYRVFSNRKPIMLITEKFPESYFQD